MGGFGASIASLFPPGPEDVAQSLRAVETATVGMGELAAAASYGLSLGEGRDPYHAVRVAYISYRIADILGLIETETQAAVYGGLLHDVGTAGLGPALAVVADAPDVRIWSQLPREHVEQVAEVAGRRKTKIEELLVSHTRRGQRIAADLPLPDGADEVVFYHHEAWDGSGFPYGESGEHTCIGARIVAFADLIDAQANSDFASPAVQDYLFQYARSQSRRRFDAEVVGAFAALAKDGEFWEDLSRPQTAAALRWWIESRPLGNGLLQDTLWALADVYDSRSAYRTAHSAGVASYAQLLAVQMGYRNESIETLRTAALVHDLGMLGVPSAILDKGTPLTELEWQQIRRHARCTCDALALAPSLAEAAKIASQHHEWINGQGYPEGSAGVGICALGRLLSVADGFEAVTSDRAYRSAASPDEALSVMRIRSGRQYDPTMLDALAHVIEEFVKPGTRPGVDRPLRPARRAA
jgi:HD-GYP domain-containing protein (c-di-GMP phosphodiesterase class II)